MSGPRARGVAGGGRADRSIEVVRRTPVLVLLLLVSLCLPAAAQAQRATPRGELQRLEAKGELDPAKAASYRDAYDAAQATLKKLHGFRHTQLKAVLANVDSAARGHRFTPTRLPSLFLTLQRNRAWWAQGPIPYAGQRTTFPPSQLVWQFYPGQGWQIQWLGTFGKANALWSIRTRDADLRRLLDEALSLAVSRGGGIAFEYLFRFDGGRPPWVSSLAQGTGLSALSRGAVRLKDDKYFTAARSALGIFKTAAPTGILRKTTAGAHYLQYSFNRKLRIVNGFTQSLNGLHDFAALANDAEGRALFRDGEAELRHELPAFDTGAWSLYSLGSPPDEESDLGYHKVLRDFLAALCGRLKDDKNGPDPTLYCHTAARFTKDLTTRPTVRITPLKVLRARRSATLRFTLSKVSAVRLTATRAGKVVYDHTARLGYGKHNVGIHPARAGLLRFRVSAVDLAGNAGAAAATAHVRPAAKKRHRD
jgi:hypothetical protein